MCVDKRRNQIGRALLLSTAGVIAAGLLVPTLHAQSFTLSQNGKSVGTASLAFKQDGGGFSSVSGAKIDMPGLKYSFTDNQSLDASYHLKTVELDGSVNGSTAKVNTSLQGQQFAMKINANGKVTNTPLTFHPQAILMPDFDPAGLQILLNLGAAHNNRDLWALIPKQTGSVAPLRVATNADMQGTLNGKPIAVHHLTLNSDAGKTEIFSSPGNELLQAEWTDQGFALARQGFKLTPPARPSAPPAKPAAPATTQPAAAKAPATPAQQ